MAKGVRGTANNQNQVAVAKRPDLKAGAVTANPATKRVMTANRTTVQVEIDPLALHAAAVTHMPYAKLAVIFGVSTRLLHSNPKYRAIIDKARAVKQQELLEAMFATAINDRNPTMQIWLGKQYLGQKDVSRVETTGKDGGPIENKTFQVTAVIPSNGRDHAPSEQVSEQGPASVIDYNEQALNGRGLRAKALSNGPAPVNGVSGDDVEWDPYEDE